MTEDHTVQVNTIKSYRVEIKHDGHEDWNMVHPLEWERTPTKYEALAFSADVSAEETTAQVRVIETTIVDMKGIVNGHQSYFTHERVVDH